MANIRARKDKTLFFDFYYQRVRCREYTKLKDTVFNRREMEKVMRAIVAEIELGIFDYAKAFPKSSRALKFAKSVDETLSKKKGIRFADFAKTWLNQQSVAFKPSYQKKIDTILYKHLLPEFGEIEVSDITKAQVLNFRATLGKVDHENSNAMGNDRINQIINLLLQIITDAADQYEFNIIQRIKPLRIDKKPIYPFTFAEVHQFLASVPADWKHYYRVAFLTGMRTAEINGLQWHQIDFDRKEIHISQTLVEGVLDSTKTVGSNRHIAMSPPVEEALKLQFAQTGSLPRQFVFCNSAGGAINYRNLSRRIWYPALEVSGLRKRRPYQTRHTAATLWLAAGESVEWIAHQLGHSNAKMLLTVYSRFVPNAVRQDG